MERRPIWLWASAAVLVLLILLRFIEPSERGGLASGVNQIIPQNAVRISIANSIGKQKWMHEAVRTFNEASRSDGRLQIDGKPIFVEIVQETVDGSKRDYLSGTMISDTLAGKIKPTVLSPADEASILRLRKDWQAIHGRAIASDTGPPLGKTPLVIAAWESRARALGCWPTPAAECTWARLHNLATSPEGWGAVGHGEWGKLKLGYGYVGEAATGTFAAVLMCMVGAGKTADLTIADVDTQTGCGASMAGLDSAKIHSGTDGPWLLDQMATGGLEYLDAAVVFEVNLISFNLAKRNNLREPIVAIYPQDGTLFASHPFTILDGAPWVSPEQVAAAKVFHAFLAASERQRELLATGLRPGDPRAPLESPIDPQFGANPQANLVVIDPPDSLVMDRIAEVWHRVKKHAVIAIVFDKSGSMAGQKIGDATKGAQAFVDSMGRDDRLIWIPFDSTVHRPVESAGEELKRRIGGTPASGETSLYDAILTAQQYLEQIRQSQGDSHRYGMVVLSDGKDTNSENGLSVLEARLKPLESDPMGIQIHTIAFGSDADEAVLKKIATAAHGRFWKGQTAADMLAVYKAIATYY